MQRSIIENQKYKIGERVRALRKKRGYTKDVLAEMADISPRFLTDIETGKKGTSAATITRLAIAFGITSDYLLFGNKRQEEIIELSLSKIDPDKQKQVEVVFHKALDLLKTPR